MKIIKDDTLSILHKVFSQGDRKLFCIKTLAGFSFTKPGTLHTEQDLWKNAQQALPKGQALDTGFPKAEAEVLVSGKCFTPDGLPVAACPVSFKLGDLKKTLAVFGDRHWQRDGLLTSVPTDPVPFSQMDLNWQHALGGKSDGKNPVGIGQVKIEDSDGNEKQPLPNVENPDHLIDSPSAKPSPVSFAPMDPIWSGRMNQTGTYDKEWLQKYWPGFSPDCNWHAFMLASEDQWHKQFFVGNEILEIENMHPEKPLITGSLPGFRLRCFLEHCKVGSEQKIFEELRTQLETVWLFPHLEFGVQVWQSWHSIDHEEEWDIRHLLAFPELLQDEMWSMTEYQAMIPLKDQEEEEELFAEEVEPPEELEEEEVKKPEIPAVDIMKKPEVVARMQENENKIAAVQAKLDQKLKQIGIDPKEFNNPPEPPVKADLFAGLSPVERSAKMAEHQKGLEQKLADTYKKLGIDPDAQVAEPKPPAKMNLEQMGALFAQLGIDDQGLMAELKSTQAETAAMKAKIAAMKEKLVKETPEQPEEEPEELEEPDEAPPSAMTRKEVLERYEAGQSFAGYNLSGIDLSHTNLVGITLTDALLEKTNFQYSDLSGADLTDAILTSADCSDANLQKAKLVQVSASKAKFTDADLSGADLTEGDFSQCECRSIVLINANLTLVNLEEAVLADAELHNCSGNKATFNRANMNRADCSGADLSEADFTGCRVAETHFVETNLIKSRFCEAVGRSVRFTGANLSESRASNDTIMPGSDFRETNMKKAYWQQADLKGARFTRAVMDGAGFVDCNLKLSDFHKVIARQTRFNGSDLSRAVMTRINLFQGSLREAKLHNTDLSHSNLFAVDMCDSKFSKTNLDGCNIKRTILMARAEAEVGA